MSLRDVSHKYKELLIQEIENGTILTEEVTVCQCGSENLEQLSKINRFGLPFGSFICQECGLIVTSPRIKQESLPYYYEKFYHPLNYGKESMANQEALFEVGQGKKIFNLVQEYLSKTQEIQVLEIGAGVGNVLKEFQEEALLHDLKVQSTGTEYSPDCIEACQKNSLNVISGDLETIKQTGKKYNLIILSHVFEHFIDLNSELEKIQAILHDDGILYIEVPGVLDIHRKRYYDFSFLGYIVHAHMYNFTLTTLKNLVEKKNFILLYGNEKVESIFKKGNSSNYKNDYNKILYYLSFLYNNYDYFSEIYTYDEIKKLQQRIENRDQDIAYRDKEIEKFVQGTVIDKIKQYRKYKNIKVKNNESKS